MDDEGRPRVAVIDDDAEFRSLVCTALTGDGFITRAAADGLAGIELVRTWAPDAVVLDVVMPQLGGFEAIAAIRRFTHIPVIVLSARGDVADRVAGLEAGADDYLAKPVALRELTARLKSALRRPQLARADVVRFGDLELDAELRSARRGTRRIPLSTREYALLSTLIRRPKRVFTRDELLELVWGHERDVTPNTVETYISYLRAKLDQPHAPRLIHTVRGVGYTLRLEE